MNQQQEPSSRPNLITWTRLVLVAAIVIVAGVSLLAKNGKDSSGIKKTRGSSKQITTSMASKTTTTAKAALTTATAKSALTTATLRAAGRPTTQTVAVAKVTPAALPRLVEFGAEWCPPCQMMAPILQELRTDYAGQLQVDFIDIDTDAAASQKYDITVIPVQIFFDASGKLVYRHEGYFPKSAILAKWKELGVELK